jgi:hypothetical protein
MKIESLLNQPSPPPEGSPLPIGRPGLEPTTQAVHTGQGGSPSDPTAGMVAAGRGMEMQIRNVLNETAGSSAEGPSTTKKHLRSQSNDSLPEVKRPKFPPGLNMHPATDERSEADLENRSIQSEDEDFIDNFVSLGRAKDDSHPKDRCTTPDELRLLHAQRQLDATRSPEERNEFHETLLDYVSGDNKGHETIEYLSSEIGKFSSVLNFAAGKQLFRGVACSEKLEELSDYKNWDIEKNRRVASQLVHSSEFAADTSGNHGLSSTSTVKEIADLFAQSRHQDNVHVHHRESRKTMLNILIDPSNPPSGYVLGSNYPYGENKLSLHEIQLSKHNRYQITDVAIRGESEVSEISILASGSALHP